MISGETTCAAGNNMLLVGLAPDWGPFLGCMGAAAAIVLSALGAAYGTAKSGMGISAMAGLKPELVLKSLIPVVMASILAMYGLYVGNEIIQGLKPAPEYSLFDGFLDFAAGLSVGICGLAAGFAIGVVGEAGLKSISTAKEPTFFKGLILILIFAEFLGLYGFVAAIIFHNKVGQA